MCGEERLTSILSTCWWVTVNSDFISGLQLVSEIDVVINVNTYYLCMSRSFVVNDVALWYKSFARQIALLTLFANEQLEQLITWLRFAFCFSSLCEQNKVRRAKTLTLSNHVTSTETTSLSAGGVYFNMAVPKGY